jgi:hypothetical protein
MESGRSQGEIQKTLAEIEAHVRRGQIVRARELLRNFRVSWPSRKALGRKNTLGLAALYRRAGLSEASLRLLQPIVRPADPRFQAIPESGEIIEYAAALISLGASREGLQLLRAISAEQFPASALFSAFAHFSSWSYAEALPFLESYCRNPLVTGYDLLVGKVNWAAAQIALGNPEGRALAAESLAQAKAENQHLAERNALLLLAQSYLLDREISRAKAALKEATAGKLSVNSLEYSLLRKWQFLAKWLERKNRKSVMDQLDPLAKDAFRHGHWEAYRDLCLFRSLMKNSKPSIARVLSGTPFPEYRKRGIRLYTIMHGNTLDLAPENSILQLDEKASHRAGPLLSLRTGTTAPTPGELTPGQVPQRLLIALASDLFKPQRLPTLHEELFPERHYDLTSSPNVVHQAIRRLRSQLRKLDSPIVIEEAKQSYLLGHRLGIWQKSPFAMQSLSRPQVASLWGCSSRSAFEYLKMALKQGQVVASGMTSCRRYSLAKIE